MSNLMSLLANIRLAFKNLPYFARNKGMGFYDRQADQESNVKRKKAKKDFVMKKKTKMNVIKIPVWIH